MSVGATAVQVANGIYPGAELEDRRTADDHRPWDGQMVPEQVIGMLWQGLHHVVDVVPQADPCFIPPPHCCFEDEKQRGGLIRPRGSIALEARHGSLCCLHEFCPLVSLKQDAEFTGLPRKLTRRCAQPGYLAVDVREVQQVSIGPPSSDAMRSLGAPDREPQSDLVTIGQVAPLVR